MTPSRARSGSARIQAQTAREVVPYEDEEEWLPPVPAPLPPEEADEAGPVPAERPPPGADALATLTERVEAIEQRLAALESAAAAPARAPAPAPEASTPTDTRGDFWNEHLAAGEVAALRQEVAMAMDQVSRLAAEVSRTQQRSDDQLGATELRLAGLATLAADLGAVETKVNELGRAQVAFQEALTTHPGLRSTQRQVDQLRAELNAVLKLVGGLEGRVEELQSVPGAMEEVATRQFERLVSEMLSLPVDIEGLYKEIESIAERVTAREDTAAVAAEKVGFATEAVVAMREEVERVLAAVAEIRAAQDEVRAWRERLERRLATLAVDPGPDAPGPDDSPPVPPATS
ncbi:MAG TPA: hypothetical protein VHH09_05205 [Acidimicrobiales bacterium]|nr:hypothetical protein [Acidimicrobiales bacterium]